MSHCLSGLLVNVHIAATNAYDQQRLQVTIRRSVATSEPVPVTVHKALVSVV